MEKNILIALFALLPAFLTAQVLEPADSSSANRDFLAAVDDSVAVDEEDDDPFLNSLECDTALVRASDFSSITFAHIAGLMKLRPQDVGDVMEDFGFDGGGTEEEGMYVSVYTLGADLGDSGELLNVKNNMEMITAIGKDGKVGMITYSAALPDRVNAVLTDFENVMKAGFYPPQGEDSVPFLFINDEGNIVMKQRFGEHPGFVIADISFMASIMND